MTEADKQYMERKMQKDWEYDEPEPSDYAEFIQQLKGIAAWLTISFAAAVLVATWVMK
jgi:hypothetical protein